MVLAAGALDHLASLVWHVPNVSCHSFYAIGFCLWHDVPGVPVPPDLHLPLTCSAWARARVRQEQTGVETHRSRISL